jgi:Cytochrome domain of cellobiose dehydrogenase
VGIPPSTASGSSGDIYLQLTAASEYRWVALGIGTGMTGATIFVMYTDGTGNVTISPRQGVSHVEPQFDSSANVELLAGSGVVNGAMTANVKYTPPSGLLSYSSTSSNWICSWKSGSPLNNKSPSATLTQHDAHDIFTFDLTKAAIASDTNPYVSSSSGSGTGTAPVSTPTSGSGGSSSGSSSITDPTIVYKQAHGIIMASAMVVLFPLGAIVLRVFGGVWIHASIQMLALIAILAGLGLGIKLAQLTDLVSPPALQGKT